MRKILITLCVGLLLATTACKKEDVIVETMTPSSDSHGTEQPTGIPVGEGVFNPVQKIVGIMVDGVESELWVWRDSLLFSIMTNDGAGNYEEYKSFDYHNYHVVEMHSLVHGMPYTFAYTYGGNMLANVVAKSSTEEIINIVISHDAATGQADHLNINLNSSMLGFLSQFIGGGFPSYVGKTSSKWDADEVTIGADLEWQGENVSRIVFNTQLDGSITLGEIRQLIDIDSLTGVDAMMIDTIAATTTLPLSIEMRDTTVFTYDNRHNPFHGFVGAFDPTTFSVNNVTCKTSSGTAILTATLQLGNGTLPIIFPYSLGSMTQTFTYTYSTTGFPLTVTSDGGSVKQYSYSE